MRDTVSSNLHTLLCRLPTLDISGLVFAGHATACYDMHHLPSGRLVLSLCAFFHVVFALYTLHTLADLEKKQ